MRADHKTLKASTKSGNHIGLNKANNPLKVSITGIDGSGKSTTLGMVVEHLKHDNRIVKASNPPIYSVVGGEREYHYRRAIRTMNLLRELADQTHNRVYASAVNAAYVLLQGRIIEPTLTHKVNPTIVLGDRDLLIDPAVYAIYYSPQLAQKPLGGRIDFLKRLTGSPHRDIIFFLSVSPEEAMRRLNERTTKGDADLNQDGGSKHRYMHENSYHLTRLHIEYQVALEEIQRRSKTEVVHIDTSGTLQADVALLITGEIRKRQREGRHN